MIVDTMTLKEVGEAILKASQKSATKVERLLLRNDKRYRRVIIKGLKERYDFQPIPFTTDGIEFILCPFSKGKKDYKKYGIAYGLFAHVYYNGTNWYCMITWDFQKVLMYCNHFFERYIERHLQDDSTVSADIVRQYFKETDYLTNYCDIDNPNYMNCIYGATNIGVSCGEKVANNIFVYKTFIDLETITLGDKKTTFDMGQKVFESLVTNKLGIRDFGFAA